MSTHGLSRPHVVFYHLSSPGCLRCIIPQSQKRGELPEHGSRRLVEDEGGYKVLVLQQRLEMNSFMETTDSDGLILAYIMPGCERNPKHEAQIELNFILWLSSILIEYATWNFLWWDLMIQFILS
jgi:hypothetical protein